MDQAYAAYSAKGGVGTLYEMMMLTQARQVGHLERTFPILADPFWKPTVEAWNDSMYHSRVARGLKPLISEADLSIITFSDNIDEIVNIISKDHDRWRRQVKRHVRMVP